mmetsp:Transcript_17447/g.19866  ORF Transcript_17447/g.19866 Transcript_17447/m.19866 type:complete len:102 (+) Transcript_17447:15-320(+)
MRGECPIFFSTLKEPPSNPQGISIWRQMQLQLLLLDAELVSMDRCRWGKLQAASEVEPHETLQWRLMKKLVFEGGGHPQNCSDAYHWKVMYPVVVVVVVVC